MSRTVECEGFAEDYSALLDGELESSREAAMRAHVDGCEPCRAELEALRGVDERLRAAPAPVVSSDLRRRLQERIAEEGSGTPRAGSRHLGGARRAPAPRRERGFGRRGRGVLGAAAAVAAVFALALWQSGIWSEGAPQPLGIPGPRVAGGGEPPARVPESRAEIASRPPLAAAPDSRGEIVEDAAGLAPVERFATASGRASPPEADTDLLDFDDVSDEDAALVALALELETIEDLDVIANLELLERLLAQEEGTG